MIEKYKISFFDQSFSKLYVRTVEKRDDGYFRCFVFWGVTEISMKTQFLSDGRIICSPSKNQNRQYFEFSSSDGEGVFATTFVEGKCRDFPEVKQVEFTNLEASQ